MRGQGFESRSSLNFFSGLNFTTAVVHRTPFCCQFNLLLRSGRELKSLRWYYWSFFVFVLFPCLYDSQHWNNAIYFTVPDTFPWPWFEISVSNLHSLILVLAAEIDSKRTLRTRQSKEDRPYPTERFVK